MAEPDAWVKSGSDLYFAVNSLTKFWVSPNRSSDL